MNHLDNLYMIFACGAGVLLQLMVTEIPYFVQLFGTSRLSLGEWGILGLLSCMPLVVHELLILSEHLTNKASGGLKEAEKGKKHENSSSQPSEAV